MDNVIGMSKVGKLKVEDIQLLMDYNFARQTLMKDIDLDRFKQLDEEATGLLKELRNAMLKG